MEKTVRISYDTQPHEVIDMITTILDNLNIEYEKIEDEYDFVITYKINEKKDSVN